MTLDESTSLDEPKQAEAILNAVHVGERFDEEHTIILYQVDGFYVEVLYHKESNVIMKIRSFSNINLLDPYLKEVSIEELHEEAPPKEKRKFFRKIIYAFMPGRKR
jgi:hypothetical protein